MRTLDLKRKVRNVPNFPQPGIQFKDITPILQDPKYFSKLVDDLAHLFDDKKFDKVVGIDARGFILAGALAYKLGAGLALVRKKGKLPHKTVAKSYTLEYGSNTVEMHQDTIAKGDRVLIVDDVIATGGTLTAAVSLVRKLHGRVEGVALMINLSFLNGLKKLPGIDVRYLIEY